MKNAMRAKETLRLEVLRSILAAFTNELVAQRRTPQEELEDPGCILVLKRLGHVVEDSHKECLDESLKSTRNKREIFTHKVCECPQNCKHNKTHQHSVSDRDP